MPKRNPRSTESLKRKDSRFRNPRKSILIVVEGEETEYNYFEAFKKELKLSTLDIKVQPSKNSDLLGVVKYAHH
ncbi:RloB domain-containing protein [Aphanothece sacrum]|uniref:RloB domain-containing protein n=1 Tax=Aphanothece sacrum FPU1 TaxID=1920663 RepID=A0A401IFL0_APHSA|nr:RloB domain-containing protein [Aphanothece sacrum]GBF80004.1 hypothetical protein AsFPU1_1405 [Aphanothece sacrum FPU1]GBF83776.1 hypothetical protein AsFPU3_0819 [Aphanothece sacrum FPU3]